MNARHVRLILSVMVIAALALGLIPLASAQEGGQPARAGLRPDAPPYGVHGPHPVGAKVMTIDTDSGRSLPTTLWYPALNPSGVEESIVYDVGIGDVMPALNDWPGHALLDAAPDVAAGPYPLVVWSHGHGGSPYYGHVLPEHLASYGFVVIAPEHTGNTMRDAPETITEQWGPILLLRPLDVSAAIDAAADLAESGDLAGAIDLEHIAVSGMSLGGYTALVAGGAQVDIDGFRAWCETNPELDPLQSCPAILANVEGMAAIVGLEAAPEGLWPSLGDPRVDVIVPIVPAGRFVGVDGAKGISVPTLMIVSGADQISVPDQNAYPIYDSLTVDKAMLVFEYANHYVLGTCPESWMVAAPGYCFDSVWDVDRAHDIAHHVVTAFLLATLKDDAEAAAALAPEAVQFPGITYETTGF